MIRAFPSCLSGAVSQYLGYSFSVVFLFLMLCLLHFLSLSLFLSLSISLSLYFSLSPSLSLLLIVPLVSATVEIPGLLGRKDLCSQCCLPPAETLQT